MNVAEYPAQPWSIEPHPPHCPDRIQTQIESLAVAEGEDVVEHAIVVGELHRRADLHDEHLWGEAQVTLIQHGLLRARRCW